MRANDSPRARRAQIRLAAEAGPDYILDVYEVRDFVEITARTGGGTTVFRVYDDGRITER